MRYHFDDRELPAQYNLAEQFNQLGVYYTDDPRNAVVSDKNLDVSEALWTLEKKDTFALLLHGASYHPESIPLKSGKLLSVKEKKVLSQHPYWISKPIYQNNGANICLLTREQALESFYKHHQHEPTIVQRYIDNPSLLSKKKFSVRLLLILTNRGEVFLYKRGYLNVASSPFSLDELQMRTSHLTNEYISDHYSANQQLCESWQDFELFMCSAKKVLIDLFFRFQCSRRYFSNEVGPLKFSFWGMDFMVDDDQNTWLLEANFGPCFPKSSLHPLFNDLYTPFWKEAAQLMLGIKRPCDKLFTEWRVTRN